LIFIFFLLDFFLLIIHSFPFLHFKLFFSFKFWISFVDYCYCSYYWSLNYSIFDCSLWIYPKKNKKSDCISINICTLPFRNFKYNRDPFNNQKKSKIANVSHIWFNCLMQFRFGVLNLFS
jgi:hypothetical protein